MSLLDPRHHAALGLTLPEPLKAAWEQFRDRKIKYPLDQAEAERQQRAFNAGAAIVWYWFFHTIPSLSPHMQQPMGKALNDELKAKCYTEFPHLAKEGGD